MNNPINEFVAEVDGKEYRVRKVACQSTDCDTFEYEVISEDATCVITASMDSDACTSGCLDPEIRQAACGALKQEIIRRIRENEQQQ